ncbi:MAG TPA: hypothetical protein PK063_15440, partial [Nitrospira sp.]|nr:hypothetical protein [Nitrospira sp.]
MKQEGIKIAPLDEKTVFHRLVVLIAVPSSRRSIYPKSTTMHAPMRDSVTGRFRRRYSCSSCQMLRV